MERIESTIDVEVPVRTAYNQWTQFEEFPRFMEGVQRVDQSDDRRLHWVTEIGGVTREWDAEIVRQEPDRSIVWQGYGEQPQVGTVTFEPVDHRTTRVGLAMEWEPRGALEKIGDSLGIVERRVRGDLERFKDFIEERGTATGAWRGEIAPTAEI